MKKACGVVALLLFVAPFSWAQQPPAPEGLISLLQERVQGTGHSLLSPVLVDFYQQRNFAPAWIENDNLSSQASVLVRAIMAAEYEGLRSNDYQVGEIEALLTRIRERGGLASAAWVKLDVLLTDAFLRYGAHLLRGRADPADIHRGWNIPSRENDLGALLEARMRTHRIEAVLTQLRPPHPGYAKLRHALARYLRIAKTGGWPALLHGPALEKEEISLCHLDL